MLWAYLPIILPTKQSKIMKISQKRYDNKQMFSQARLRWIFFFLFGMISFSFAHSTFDDDRNKPYNLIAPQKCPGLKRSKKQKVVSWNTFASSNSNIDGTYTSQHIVIPCDIVVKIESGTHLVLDGGLAIRGTVIFEDGGDPIIVETPFVLVLGSIKIGSSIQYFQSKVTFILKDHPENASLKITEGLSSTYDFGQKSFVVLGGKVAFYGTNINAPSFAPLMQSVHAGSNKIFVRGNVQSVWNVGDTIGIASSSNSGDLTSKGKISAMRITTKASEKVTEIKLETPLENSHSVRSVTRSDTNNKVLLRPEVVRLDRNIVIRGSHPEMENVDVNAKNVFLGGHFIITHSGFPQILEGVEFIHMGQAGKTGRYPIHFHFGGYVHEKSRISHNSIHDSFQRCIVVHATNNLKVAHNVAFHTHGHCYVTEDGLEHGNQFIGNLAINVKKALRHIPTIYGDAPTDSEASGFWFAASNNDVIENIVAGAYNTGFWYESLSQVSGESAIMKLPGYDKTTLKGDEFGIFQNNVAHSVNVGLNPGFGKYPKRHVIFKDFFSWTVNRGFHSGSGVNLSLSGAIIVDFNVFGISAINTHGFELGNSLLIGELEKPERCDEHSVAGLMLSPSSLPIGAPAGMFELENIHFQHLSSSTNCQKRNTAIEIVMSNKQNWGVNSFVNGITFDEKTVDTNWLVHNYKNVADLGLLTIHVKEKGAGSLQPNGAIVSAGWENWKKVTEGCQNMQTLGEGFNLVYCPLSCWKHLNLEFEEIGERIGSQIEVSSISTG